MNKLDYRQEIAAALRRELGGSHQAIKSSMNWTGASERTAKNWLAGAHGPAGEHLIELMRHSDEVVETVLALSGRSEICIALELACLRGVLIRMLSTAEEIIGTEHEGDSTMR
ncbi:hypothetical protein [Pseudophaeobacter sp.]|uniref:hypothetical protein n=1 Tax=Pseudophaeobacter sp. TaxID=1971739 RepID=UPI0032983E69